MSLQTPLTRPPLPTRNREGRLADEAAAVRQEPLAAARGMAFALLLGLLAWVAIGVVAMVIWWR